MGSRLALRFKGDRTYLHGTDIYNAVADRIQSDGEGGPLRDIDIAFHRLASRQLELVPEEPPIRGGQAVVTFAGTQNGRRRSWALLETADDVTARYEYPESEIVRRMEIDVSAKRGVLRETLDFSAIEIWVAMVKAVHLEVHDPGLKWLFVRGRFSEYLFKRSPAEWSVAVVANFNNRLTRNAVFVDGEPSGEIYFSPQVAHARD